MSIEIIQVITLDEFKETGVAGHFDDDTIKAAINTSYIRLNALCNQNIKKRWNITDTTDPLYLKEEYKEITKQAFFLQTEYNLVNNLNLSSEGSQQESLGSWSHSYNNPKEKPFICDGVQDMLQQATLFVPVKSVSLNVANNKCVDVNDICGELPAGDKYDLSFVRWGEANAKFLPKNIGIEFANKILITDDNGYIRTTDIDPMLINYLTKGEASVIYQRMQDKRLLTTDKTVVGAINELFNTTPATINWDTEPTAGHGEGYAVSSEGIKTYVDTKETNLQLQITTETSHREDGDSYLQGQITTNTNSISDLENDKQDKIDDRLTWISSHNVVEAINSLNNSKQSTTDNSLITENKTIVGGINEINSKLTDIVKAVNITSPQFTITAGQAHIEHMAYTIPTGYKFLCLANITTSGFILPTTVGGAISPTSGTFVVYINNLSSTQVAGYVMATILFIKE